MSDFNINQEHIQIIKALYDNAESAVLLNDHTDTEFRTAVGVKQGCLLSPIDRPTNEYVKDEEFFDLRLQAVEDDSLEYFASMADESDSAVVVAHAEVPFVGITSSTVSGQKAISLRSISFDTTLDKHQPLVLLRSSEVHQRTSGCFELLTDDRGCTPKDKYVF
ncbi:hypothetical protein CAPTEDRAFT_211258 [Capitella teleta]|uniref:Uncharacterized protein n=1 Tax=Capitella teleta TaxID=283909 RepID=R7TIK3_CAPTE|nr:hypothetical protein CAPTEDRAFT_211258 [Capitella teleta]|eukprot:ELT93569.1 hypothetical protein CAPTEDRAFT_211258 [Capitella teleta]